VSCRRPLSRSRNVSQATSRSRPLAERSRRPSAPIAVTSRTEPLTPMTPRSPSVQRAFVRANSRSRSPTASGGSYFAPS